MNEQYTQEEQRLLKEFLGDNWQEEHCMVCGGDYAHAIDLNDPRVIWRLLNKLYEVHGHVEIQTYAYGVCVKLGSAHTKFQDNVACPTFEEAICRAVLAWLKERGE